MEDLIAKLSAAKKDLLEASMEREDLTTDLRIANDKCHHAHGVIQQLLFEIQEAA